MSEHIQPQNKPDAFFAHLEARGLVHDHTPQAKEYLRECAKKGETPKVYVGFDPSFESLQVGNLQSVLLLRRAQLFGLQPIILLGGATGLIGDPSGKKEERSLIDKSLAEANLKKIRAQIEHFVDTKASAGKTKAVVANNYDWFADFGFLDFLRDVGKHITVNYMTAKDSVKIRMETGISYAEFGYMLIQGYDYLHLFEAHGCRLQMGGSDQWGNITTGMELIRRKHSTDAHAISSPLLTDAAGNKFGKSEKGAIYLDAKFTSPFQFYQFWLGQADADVPKLLKALTLLSDERIHELEQKIQTKPEAREAQQALAQELTDMVHGKEAAQAASKATKVIFSKDPKALDAVDAATLKFLAHEVPSTKLEAKEVNLLDLLVQTGLCKSKGEAKRHLQSGAVTINREKAAEGATVTSASFQGRAFLLLGIGKSNLHIVLK